MPPAHAGERDIKIKTTHAGREQHKFETVEQPTDRPGQDVHHGSQTLAAPVRSTLPKAASYKGSERRATSTPLGAAARSTTASAATPAKLLPQRPAKAKETVAATGSDDGDWESF